VSVHRELHRSITTYAIGAASIVSEPVIKLPTGVGTYTGIAMDFQYRQRLPWSQFRVLQTTPNQLSGSLLRWPIWHSAGVQFRGRRKSFVL